jgi:hypothetical protein
MKALVLCFAILTCAAAVPSWAEDTASAQADPEESDLKLWTYGYTVPAGNNAAVTGVPSAAANGFRGQGYGAACVLVPPANQCHDEDE